MMFIRDSLQVQFAVEEQFSGTLKRLVLEENLQLTDSSRAQLATQWSELTPTLKATVEDANNVQGAVRAIAIWRILVKLLAKVVLSECGRPLMSSLEHHLFEHVYEQSVRGHS